MADKTRYKVWGYWKRVGLEAHPDRKCIGVANTLEDARQLKDDAGKLNWPIVCIFQDDRIVEPAVWAGLRHPHETVR
jgi:hypothetical protein